MSVSRDYSPLCLSDLIIRTWPTANFLPAHDVLAPNVSHRPEPEPHYSCHAAEMLRFHRGGVLNMPFTSGPACIL